MIKTWLHKLPEPVKSAIKEHIYPSMLKEGEIVPEWHLQAHDREWHRQGVFWSVMQFLPADPECPTVKDTLIELEKHYPRLKELGARLFVIMPAEEDVLQNLARDLELSYPILTDRGASVSRVFRAAIQLPLKSIMIPTLYLVNPNKMIRLSNRGTPSVAAVIRSIEALQQATKAGM